MKRINIAMAAMAAALSFTFASCADLDIETPASDVAETEVELVEGGDMPVTFNCYMADDDATRTEFHDNTIWWSEGDKIRFYQRYIKTAGSTTYTIGYADAKLKSSSKSVSVTTSFTTPAEYPANYWALYPSESVVSYRTSFTGETALYTCMNVPAEQNPSLVSFDPAADLLVSKYITSEEQQTSFKMQFRRVVALGKMTIKNLPSTNAIKSIKIENPDAYIAGSGYYELENVGTRVGVKSGTGSKSITLNYTEEVTANSSTGMTAYFACRAFTLTAGKKLNVTVTTVADESFSKDIEVPSGREIKFEEGIGTRFNVDMSTAEKSCEFFSLGKPSSRVNTISDVYCRFSPISSISSTISSVKYSIVAKDEYNPEINYIDETALAFTNTDLSKINGGTSIVISKSSCAIDKEYVFIVESTNSDGKTCQLTWTERTDWFQLALVGSSKGGVQLQLTGVGLDPAKCRNYRVMATADLPTTASEIETYYKNTLNPETKAATMEAINDKNGMSYNLGITTYNVDKTNTSSMVAGINYTAMMLVYNTRGESKFVYASANAK